MTGKMVLLYDLGGVYMSLVNTYIVSMNDTRARHYHVQDNQGISKCSRRRLNLQLCLPVIHCIPVRKELILKNLNLVHRRRRAGLTPTQGPSSFQHIRGTHDQPETHCYNGSALRSSCCLSKSEGNLTSYVSHVCPG